MTVGQRKMLIFACGFLMMMLGLAGLGTAQYPLTVVDDMGSSLTLEGEPLRIVSLAPSNTEILFALGLSDRIVGVDTYSDYPEAARTKETMGSLTQPSLERLVSVQPDIVFVSPISVEILQTLRNAGLPLFCVQSENLDGIMQDIITIGRITNQESAAAEIVGKMAEKTERIKQTVSRLEDGERRRVFYEVWSEPLMSAGPGSFIHDLIGMAGGINVAGDAPAPWAQFSLETLVQRDPHVIITSFETTVDELRSEARAAWSEISAVREGRVGFVEQNIISRPGPRIVDGLEALAKAIYPELF